MAQEKITEQDIHTDAGALVNDFCLTICTVNGSGSATANTTLLRALFHMGIPVSGKNIFPSNIKGLPTWFSIRVSKEGYLARVEHDDIIVQMNPSTFESDLTYDVPGGVVFYADHINLPITRDDVITYPMPVKDLIEEAEVPRNLRDYMENMVYVGVVSQILGIDLDKIEQSLQTQLKKNLRWQNEFLLWLNWLQISGGKSEKKDRYYIKPMLSLDDYIMRMATQQGLWVRLRWFSIL